jgi:Delta3-Delta2-enoyl-CoA isomerase
MPTLSRINDVFVLDLGDGENRFNASFLSEMQSALNTVCEAPSPRALVTTATGKFWSNGLDLEWMGATTDDLKAFMDGVHDLFATLLELGVPTVAAIQGHAFAAGAMLATAHDFRIMREDRGYYCLPEVDLRMLFTPGMAALLDARLPMRTMHEAMTTGRRYSGPEAVHAGIVDRVAPLEQVVPAAIEYAQRLANKDGATLAAIKRQLFGPAIEILRGPQG